MKRTIILISAAVMLMTACNDDNTVGLSIQPPQDAITVVVDTFNFASSDFAIEAVSAQCVDSLSMLLGEYQSQKYGTTKAELIVQFMPPIGHEFPDSTYNPQPDSLMLLMYYNSWFGSTTEPIELSMYELNKSTPDYSTQYFTNFDISEFVDANDNQLMGKKIITAIDQTWSDSVLSAKQGKYLIKHKFSDTQLQRFFDISKNTYSSINDFLNEFKGLYITTSYGKSTMLYLNEIDLRLFYHYTYKKNGVDTTANTYITYPANKEVRQLNRITHVGLDNIMNKTDSVNYITTAGGIYPKVTLPLGKIRKNVHDSIPNKILKINSAILSLEATEIDSSANAMGVPPVLLLINVTEYEEFLKSNYTKAVADSTVAVAMYNSTTKEYVFDIARMVSNVVNKAPLDFDATVEYMLIPVDVFYSSAGVLTDIRPQKCLGAVTVRSGNNHDSPMRLELVYSGF
ncbi:MAG: DUF4270 domain-containing protein [Prevotellaceae bacterium]|jgi:hypothetical protein|nr:DUF4270 domain-containing protein [Prevotellaceae bacterium]